MIGFADIPPGAYGQCTNTFSFTGSGAQHVDYSISLAANYSGNFDLQSEPGVRSWSPCGDRTAILNMNTACNISPTHLPALIAVSDASSSDWRAYLDILREDDELISLRRKRRDDADTSFIRSITLAANSPSSSACSGGPAPDSKPSRVLVSR